MSSLPTRAGPFSLGEQAQLPGSGTWFSGQRVTHSRGPNTVWVCLALPGEPAVHEALQGAHNALSTLTDPRWPQVVAWYDGSSALVVTARAGVALEHLLGLRRSDRIPMSPATLLDIALEVCEALVHAHSRSWVHGALTPENITLDPSGEVTVWGLGEQLPTPVAWRAPEGGPASFSTDQWQFGALIAALLTGYEPDLANGNTRGTPTVLDRQWPALARVVRRLTAPHALDRYHTIQQARRDLLALARKTDSPSARRDLGQELSLALAPTKPAPTASCPAIDERSPMAQPPRIKLPLPTSKTPATELYEEVTARPLDVRRVAPVPQESMSVVRPSVGVYVPTASVSTKRPFTDIDINPSPNPSRPISVVAVEMDDFDDDDSPMAPLGLSMPTDDMPLPTPGDLFGDFDLGEDELIDAPAAAPPHARLPPTPIFARPSGPTAVPPTDPGLSVANTEIDAEEDRFYSDVSAGLQGAYNAPSSEFLPSTRERFPVERVAQAMMVVNAALALVWTVVRVF